MYKFAALRNNVSALILDNTKTEVMPMQCMKVYQTNKLSYNQSLRSELGNSFLMG